MVESDDETDMEMLFKSSDPEDEIFYFKSISVFNPAEDQTGVSSEVRFEYSLSNKTNIVSHLVIASKLSADSLPILACIGMCILPWYWMGYATKRIVVEAVTLSSADITFWQYLYDNVLLEFKYVNKIDFSISISSTESTTESVQSTFSPARSLPNEVFANELESPEIHISDTSNRILCPLGGSLHSNCDEYCVDCLEGAYFCCV